MPDHAFVPAPPSVTEPGGVSTSVRTEVVVTAWIDPIVDRRGHDPRSRYVERFWLGVLGPSATWLVRRLTDELASDDRRSAPIDLAALARTMGMSYTPDRPSPFARALQRCVMFGVVHPTPDGYAVRRRLPDVTERHLRRLPPAVAVEHDRWIAARIASAIGGRDRARRLAAAMVDAGDCTGQIEGQLVAVGVDPATAAEVTGEIRSAA